MALLKTNAPVFKGAKPIAMIASLAIGLAVWFTAPPEGIQPKAWQLLAVFAALITGLIGKALPMGGISFLALTALIATKTLTIQEAFSGFSHPVIWLIVAAFLISRSIIKTGLGMRLAYLFVSLLGRKTLGLGYGICLTELLLAPAIPSSTARAGGILYPIARALSLNFGSDPEKHSQRLIGSFLISVVYYSNIITSAMFMTAMAANPLITTLLKEQGVPLTWGQWALAAIVPGSLSLLIVPYVIYLIYPPEIKSTPEARRLARHHLQEMGMPSKYEWSG